MTSISQKWPSALDILVPFSRNYSSKLYASQISKSLSMPQKTIHRKLELLAKSNLLDFVRNGRNKHYFLNLKKREALSLLSMVETFKEIKFINSYSQIKILFNELPGTFILFGSYAKGLAKNHSDIDLILIGRKSKKITEILKRYPFEVNIFYFTLAGFKNLVNKKEHLGVEIVKDHIIFGDKEEIIKLFMEYNTK